MKNLKKYQEPWEYSTFEDFFSEVEIVFLLNGVETIANDWKFCKYIKSLYTDLGGENVEDYIVEARIKNLGAEGEPWPVNGTHIHTDYKPYKKFTAIIYLSENSKGSYIYSSMNGDNKQEIESKRNKGYCFIPTDLTYHSQPDISEWEGVRTIVMYNLVDPKLRNGSKL